MCSHNSVASRLYNLRPSIHHLLIPSTMARSRNSSFDIGELVQDVTVNQDGEHPNAESALSFDVSLFDSFSDEMDLCEVAPERRRSESAMDHLRQDAVLDTSPRCPRKTSVSRCDSMDSCKRPQCTPFCAPESPDSPLRKPIRRYENDGVQEHGKIQTVQNITVIGSLSQGLRSSFNSNSSDQPPRMATRSRSIRSLADILNGLDDEDF